MSTESESVLFVVNGIPDQAGPTEYQHAKALCESFETTVLCGGDVPPVFRRLPPTSARSRRRSGRPSRYCSRSGSCTGLSGHRRR